MSWLKKLLPPKIKHDTGSPKKVVPEGLWSKCESCEAVLYRTDLEKNSRTLKRHLGQRPRTMVWPYGAYDRIGIEEAARAGMSINFTLDAGRAAVGNTEIVPRILVNKEMPLSTFSYLVQYAYTQRHNDPVHAIKIHLDRD